VPSSPQKRTPFSNTDIRDTRSFISHDDHNYMGGFRLKLELRLPHRWGVDPEHDSVETGRLAEAAGRAVGGDPATAADQIVGGTPTIRVISDDEGATP
jgi:hypothetical protein